MNTGVHLNTSPAGIVCVAVALLCVLLVTFEETVVPDDGTGSIIMTSVPENFCARESMFLLKVSLRSELSPNLVGLGDSFDFEYMFSVCEEIALFAEGFVSMPWQAFTAFCFSESFLVVDDPVVVWCSALVVDLENDFVSCDDLSCTGDWSNAGRLDKDNGGWGSSNEPNHGCCRHSVTVKRSLEKQWNKIINTKRTNKNSINVSIKI